MLPVHSRLPVATTNYVSTRSRMACATRPVLRWLLLVSCLIIVIWLFAPFPLEILSQNPKSLPYLQKFKTPQRKQPGQQLPKLAQPPYPTPALHPQQVEKKPLPERASKVKAAFVHAYTGYQKNAFLADELLPVIGGKVNNLNGWGSTIFDSIDTMWIMGLDDMFHESVNAIANTTFALPESNYAPFFETVIRYLGGLLSGYALSGETVLLTRADDLGKVLAPAFNTTSGFPMYAVNTVSGKTRPGWSSFTLWAEAGSNQLEYKYLAHLTGRAEYYQKTESIMNTMYNTSAPDGLFPSMWDVETGTPANTHYSIGAYADSAHEYLLKQWLLTGKSETKARDAYIKSVDGILNKLLYITPTRKLLYVTDIRSSIPSHTLEHLSCFLPGTLALGVHTLELSPRQRQLHMWAAEGLAHTCWLTYADQATGLGPDEMRMSHFGDVAEGLWMTNLKKWERDGAEGGVPPGLHQPPPEKLPGGRDYTASQSSYLLRPETIESFFILWKTTGDVKWRERGWSIFEAIEKHSKTKYGYASILTVDAVQPIWKDEMPSYFLAETLKYLFLLFVDEDIIPLDKWVFNTEAHPLPIFNWRPWEIAHHGIPS